MMKIVLRLIVLCFAVFDCALSPAADLERGELLFQTCTACHTILGDGLGPDLFGIYGQKAAQIPGFAYSEALQRSELTWDGATLRAYLDDPQKLVQGTSMTFPGYDDAADLDDVIAYLKTLR